jgi:8-oxo-dGTP pyrophosphatase MutT (NUDIX family)
MIVTDRDHDLDHELIPAATVVLIRDGSDGVEALMLRRNSKIAFGGMWVFPGGRVDDHELDPADHLGSARVAAVREVEEETGLVISGGDLETWSYWIPPTQASVGPSRELRRRFSTWFFVAPAPDGEVAVDGGEIHEHRWLTPDDAMARRHASEIELVPPTWVTLLQLSAHGSVADAMSWAAANEPEEFRTRPISKDPVTLTWAGDIAHDAHDGRARGPAPADSHRDGPRHRLILDPTGWLYERTAS